MDGPANPTLASRIHSRHLYQAQQAPQQRLPAPDQPQPHDQFLPPGPDAGPRSRESMSRGHRFFHRRAVLDNVEIVTVLATVDEAGNIIAQETLPPVPPPSLPDVIATAAAAIVSAAPVAQPAQLAIPSAAPALPALPALPAVPIPAQPPVPVPAPALPSVAPAVPSSVAAPALPAVPDTALPDTALPVPNPAVAALVPGPALPVVPTLATSSVAVPAPPTLSAAALAAVSVPVVPSVPVPVLPSVPAVPPFPSDLIVPTVPAYPFPSLNYVAQPVVTSASNASPSSIGSTATPSLPSAINSAANSTLSSTPTLLSSSVLASFDSISASSATDLAVSVNAVPTRSPSDSQSLPASTRTSLTQAIISSQSARSIASASSVLTASSVPTTTANYGGWGGNAPGTGGAPAPTTSATSTADADSSPSALETPKVVGSVLGSLAGVALILALILFLLKRHKQKRGGALQLTGDDHHHQEGNRSMTQAPAPSNTLVPIAFLKRFSGMSGKTAETSTSAGERSFQRVSGRKLPSAFSEGMTSDQFSRGDTMSSSSFYQDDHGLYGSTGLSKEMGKEIGESSAPRESGQMSFRPGPARTPIIRHPDDENPFADRHHLSPPHSPVGDLPPRGTLGRSLPSADGSRSSKFTENV